MMKIGRWEGNEIIYTIDVNGNSVNLIENFDFTMDILGANMVVSGMVVSEAAVPDMTVLISAGIAKDFTVGTFLIGEALAGVVTASDPVNDRRDIIEVRRLIDNISPATRQFKDPDTEDITESTIDTEVQYITEIKVLAGTPGTGLSLAVETGWIKIAEILVPAASLTVVDANIYNVDAEKAGVNNTNWTTTMASIHQNGTISDMKTKIIDNESDIATNVTAIGLNTTHRGSNGTDHINVVNGYKGKIEVTLSNYDNDSAPSVQTGSVFDNNGVLIKVISDATPTGYSGISNSTIFYLYWDESAGSFIYSITVPTWSDLYQGWYNGDDRALFSMYKDSGGTLYQNKNLLLSQNNLEVSHNLKVKNNIEAGGYAIFDAKRITSTNYISVNVNEGVLFSQLDDIIPNNGDEILANGALVISSALGVVFKISRVTSTTMQISRVTLSGVANLTITEGINVNYIGAISW